MDAEKSGSGRSESGGSRFAPFGGRMSRRDFLRRAGVVAGGAAVAGLGLSGAARADWPDTSGNVIPDGTGGYTVFPTNDSSQDPVHVQQAINNTVPGKTVTLMPYAKNTTTFTPYDFGATSVSIDKYVDVVGITDPVTGNKPMIGGTHLTYEEPWTPIFECGDINNKHKGKITNLHLAPYFDIPTGMFAAIGVYSSDGIEISDCKITLTDQVYFFGFGIWFIFDPPNSLIGPKRTGTGTGPLVVRNNVIEITPPDFASYGVYGAIGFGNFLSAPVPSTLIESNDITARKCNFGTITTHGNPTNLVISKNVIRGDNDVMIFLYEGAEAPDYVNLLLPENIQVYQNDTTSSTSNLCQMLVGVGHHDCAIQNNRFGPSKDGQLWCFGFGNSFTNNNYGPAPVLGVYVSGTDPNRVTGHTNTFTNENFLGAYPGWASGNGCFLLDYGSESNKITALKNGLALQGFAICDQVLDLNYEFTGQTSNETPGSVKCAKKDPALVQAMQAKARELNAKLDQMRLDKWGTLNPPGQQ